MRTLAKEHGWLVVDQGLPQVWDFASGVDQSQQWRQLSPQGFASSTYFDLAGMSQQELTLFFEAAVAQDFLPPVAVNGNAGDNWVLIDLMTSHPLSDTELLNFVVWGNFKQQGVLTYDQTIYARVRSYVIDVDTAAWGHFVIGDENQIGSLEATASDRVYSYRIVFLNTLAATQVQVPPVRHLLRTEAREEKDYEYLMRLKRSYELQQEPDVDKA